MALRFHINHFYVDYAIHIPHSHHAFTFLLHAEHSAKNCGTTEREEFGEK